MAGRGLDMTAVLTKAFAFVAIIAMGYILKRVGFFHAKDFYLISNIVIKLTLPQYVGLQYRQFHHALCAELFKPCGICGHQSV